MTIAVLALQGAFIEHEQMLQRLGVDCFEVRTLADWGRHKDGLIIPGGESTTQLKLLADLQLLEPVREYISHIAHINSLSMALSPSPFSEALPSLRQ